MFVGCRRESKNVLSPPPKAPQDFLFSLVLVFFPLPNMKIHDFVLNRPPPLKFQDFGSSRLLNKILDPRLICYKSCKSVEILVEL